MIFVEGVARWRLIFLCMQAPPAIFIHPRLRCARAHLVVSTARRFAAAKLPREKWFGTSLAEVPQHRPSRKPGRQRNDQLGELICREAALREVALRHDRRAALSKVRSRIRIKMELALESNSHLRPRGGENIGTLADRPFVGRFEALERFVERGLHGSSQTWRRPEGTVVTARMPWRLPPTAECDSGEVSAVIVPALPFAQETCSCSLDPAHIGLNIALAE